MYVLGVTPNSGKQITIERNVWLTHTNVEVVIGIPTEGLSNDTLLSIQWEVLKIMDRTLVRLEKKIKKEYGGLELLNFVNREVLEVPSTSPN